MKGLRGEFHTKFSFLGYLWNLEWILLFGASQRGSRLAGTSLKNKTEDFSGDFANKLNNKKNFRHFFGTLPIFHSKGSTCMFDQRALFLCFLILQWAITFCSSLKENRGWRKNVGNVQIFSSACSNCLFRFKVQCFFTSTETTRTIRDGKCLIVYLF